MSHYKVDKSLKWDYENGFYLTCETGRIGKMMNHLEIYKKIVNLPGDILEFGVYKGTSLVRLLTFRDLLESSASRKVYGFDMFGKFPDDLTLESDKKFVAQFEGNGGWGISKMDLDTLLKEKNFSNYELIEGDINQTITKFLQEKPNLKISLLHIDVDVYEPTLNILKGFWDKIVPGGILMLDDYGTVEGETRAVDEFFSNTSTIINKMPFYHIPSYIVK